MAGEQIAGQGSRWPQGGLCLLAFGNALRLPATARCAAIVGPYDKRLGGAQSSVTWFYVEHPPGRLPAEGQPPEAVGCVGKALQTLQLVDDGGRAVAEIAAWPVCGLQQLVLRYAQKHDAGEPQALCGLQIASAAHGSCLWAAR